MTDDLWADSPGSIGGCGLARRLSEEQEKSIVTLDGARKILGACSRWLAARWLSVEWVLSMEQEKFLVRAAPGWQAKVALVEYGGS